MSDPKPTIDYHGHEPEKKHAGGLTSMSYFVGIVLGLAFTLLGFPMILVITLITSANRFGFMASTGGLIVLVYVLIRRNNSGEARGLANGFLVTTVAALILFIASYR
jgi:uncharacterized membrane protein HdeD (DUF308 family)